MRKKGHGGPREGAERASVTGKEPEGGSVYRVSYSDFKNFILSQMGTDKKGTRFLDGLLATRQSLTSPRTTCLCRRHEQELRPQETQCSGQATCCPPGLTLPPGCARDPGCWGPEGWEAHPGPLGLAGVTLRQLQNLPSNSPCQLWFSVYSILLSPRELIVHKLGFTQKVRTIFRGISM